MCARELLGVSMCVGRVAQVRPVVMNSLCSVLQCVAVCVAVCCNVLQCVAVIRTVVMNSVKNRHRLS